MFKKSIPIRGWEALFLILALVSACNSNDLTPPTLSITSPAPNSPVSGTVAVLVDMSVSSVDLYVRGKGSSGRGVFVNSAVGSSPFVINWNTSSNTPNQTELELVAVAKDASGNESESPAVAVKTQNTGTPSLQLLTAYSFASDPLLEGSALQSAGGLVNQLPAGLSGVLSASEIFPPLESDRFKVESEENNLNLSTSHYPQSTNLVSSEVSPQQASDRKYRDGPLCLDSNCVKFRKAKNKVWV